MCIVLLRYAVIACALALGVGFGTGAAVASPPVPAGVDTAAVDRFVTDQMTRHRIPGLSVALIDHHQLGYTRGYGTAWPGRAMDPAVPMPIASITKPLTAVAVLQLAERGALALDAPVRTYLPWFTVADATASATITVRQLLQHTSGLSDRGYRRIPGADTSLEEAVQDLRHARPTAAVGTTHQYFNPNYAVLALLIETVSAQPYGDYLDRHIFTPLQMHHSTATANTAEAGPPAQGHTKLFGFPVPVRDGPRPAMTGAGSVLSTAPDLARFGAALGNGGTYGGIRILSEAGVAQMHTVPAGAGFSYGLGWDQGSAHGETVRFHDGLGPGYMGQLVVLPERGTGFVVLMNQAHLFDAMIVTPALRTGLLDLLQGHPATAGGWSIKWIGLLVLTGLLVVVALTARSLAGVRGWTARARTATVGQLARAIAPHVLVPAAVVLLMYQVVPALLGGRAFDLGYVGRFFLPDLVVLLAVAIVPDLLQGLYLLVVAIHARRRPGPSAAAPSRQG